MSTTTPTTFTPTIDFVSQRVYFHIRLSMIDKRFIDHLKKAIEEHCVYGYISNVEGGNEMLEHIHCVIKLKAKHTANFVCKHFVLNSPIYKVATKDWLEESDYYVAPKLKHVTQQQFIDYALKNGSQYKYKSKELISEEQAVAVMENNILGKELKVSKRKELYEDIRSGRYSYYDMIEKHGDFYFHSSVQGMINCLYSVTTNDQIKPEAYWIYGGTGCGKSSSVALLYPNIFRKNVSSKFYEGLGLNRKIWLDEVDTFNSVLNGMGTEAFKSMLDGLPVTAEVKYGTIRTIFETVIVCSNVKLGEFLSTIDVNHGATYKVDVNGLIKQFNRRFKRYSIEQWLDMNDLFCFKKVNEFGGVFHIDLYNEVYAYYEEYKKKNNALVLNNKLTNKVKKLKTYQLKLEVQKKIKYFVRKSRDCIAECIPDDCDSYQLIENLKIIE